MENNPKYIQIVETANHLFYKYGIRRVTIEEICKEAGVSKMTFYKFFKNKVDLALVLSAKIFDEGEHKYRELMNEDISFEAKIKKTVRLKFEGSEELSAEFVKEIYDNSFPELYDYWESRRKKMLQMILRDYTDAQENGWMRKDIKPEFILYITNKLLEMASDTALQSMYKDMRSLIMELTNLFFYGILERKDPDG